MPSTYTLISSNVLSTSAASVTFSAIPSTYTDLVLRVSARDSQTGTGNFIPLQVQFNNTGVGFYSLTNLLGNGSTASSSRASNRNSFDPQTALNSSSSTTSTFTSIEVYVPNYNATMNYRVASIISATEQNASAANITTTAGIFSNSLAINRIDLIAVSSFVSGSSFYLYGIKNS